MDIQSLKLFVVVASKLNFVSAALEMDVDPSSVSRKINQLEKELGARLFNRNTRTMTLTNFGQRFISHADFMLREYELALENAHSERNTISGPLRVTTSVAFAERQLVPILPKFLDAYPDVSIHLIPTDSTLDLTSESIDVAVRLTPKVCGNFIVTKLFDTRYAIYATPEFISQHGPLASPEALERMSPIVYELPGFRSHWKFRRKDSKSAEFLVEVNSRLAVASPSILRKFVLAGQGPAMLANWLVADDFARGRLVDILPDFEATPTTFDTGAWILYINNTHVPMKVKAFVKFLKSEIGTYR